MIICFDIDDTITHWNENRDYVNFKPDTEMVDIVNKLYKDGHIIHLYTSRGMRSVGEDNIGRMILPELLINLEKIGLKYHQLLTHKPYYDIIVDDKAMRPDDFKELILNHGIEHFEKYVP